MAAHPGYDPILYKPQEITGFWDESNSWHDGCYINSTLNSPVPVFDIEGPDVEKFFEKYIVNSFANRPIGKGLHAIMCTEKGKILADGILMKRGEHSYRGFFLMGIGVYAEMEAGNYDVKYIDRTGEIVLYQFCGPRTLELMESVTNKDLHDLKFIHFTEADIEGMPVEILRVGMAGTLGYEIHCRMEDAKRIYNIVMEHGEKYGLRQLGYQAYRNTHTEGGFPQSSIHFWYADPAHALDNVVGQRAKPEDPAALIVGEGIFSKILIDGSLSDAPYSNFLVSPYDVGWDKMVRFDHDFVGRAALEEDKKNAKRTVVTLEWNKDDILDIWAAVFEQGETYKRLDCMSDLAPYAEFEYFPDFNATLPPCVYMLFDRVYAGDKEIGISSGRMFSPHYRKMLSLCVIDREYAATGTEVEILWGNPGTRQKRIRAIVQSCPYGDIIRNEKFDVSTLPQGNK